MLQTMTVGHESPDWDDGLLMIGFQVWNAANNTHNATKLHCPTLLAFRGGGQISRKMLRV